MILIQILIVLACAQLWRMGGNGYKWARACVVPFLIALFSAIVLETWWLFLALYATYQIVRIGYGEDSFLWKISGGRGWLARGFAGLLYGVIGSLPIFIITHAWGFYAIYCVLNFLIGAVLGYFKVKDVIIERVIGAGVGSIVFFI